MGYQTLIPIVPDSSVDNGTLGKIVQKPDGVILSVSEEFHRKLQERSILDGLVLLRFAYLYPQTTAMLLGEYTNQNIIIRDGEIMRRRLRGIVPDELLDPAL